MGAGWARAAGRRGGVGVAVALGTIGGVATVRAQEPASLACAPARDSIAIRAEAPRRGEIAYVISNSRRETLRWIRVGEGGTAFIEIPADRTPALAAAPPGWTGRLARGASDRVSFLWEADAGDAGLPAGARLELGIRTRSNPIVRDGRLPLDLGSVPFSAGDASGACWFGRTTSRWEPPEGGYASGLAGVTVRPIAANGVTYVIVDAPMHEPRLLLSRRAGLFVTIPFAISWGTAGGFSADASLGAGLAWAPSPYVSVSAQTRFGTFFFNNRTRLRAISADLSLPIRHATFAEGVTRRSRFLVVGVEYFDRDVTRRRGFLEGPQWFVSGRGLAVRVGIRGHEWSY
jgi:hypothetical protein